MSKPPTSVRSIRLTDDTWAWIAEAALIRRLTVNAYIAAVLADVRHGPKGQPVSAGPYRGPVRPVAERAAPKASAKHVSRLKGEWKAP